MTSAKVIYDQRTEILKGTLEARITVHEVPRSKKFPDGIKLRCLLLDIKERVPRLLLDNHEPYGYHLHTKLPHDKSYRVKVHVKDYEEAIVLFLNESEKLVKNET